MIVRRISVLKGDWKETDDLRIRCVQKTHDGEQAILYCYMAVCETSDT